MNIRAGVFFGVAAVAAVSLIAFGGAIAHVAAGSPDQSGPVIHYNLVGSDDGAVGPDGKKHDTFRAVDPTTVKLGDTVTIEVANYDDMPHGMSFPDLGVTKMIAAGKDGQPTITRFTFTASKAGTFRWYCPIPCDGDNNMWAMSMDSAGKGMSQDGFMAGYITVS